VDTASLRRVIYPLLHWSSTSAVYPSRWFCQNSASGQNAIVPHLLRRCVHGLPELANRVSAEVLMSVELKSPVFNTISTIQQLIRQKANASIPLSQMKLRKVRPADSHLAGTRTGPTRSDEACLRLFCQRNDAIPPRC